MTMRRAAATFTAAVALATGGFLSAGAQAADTGGPDNVVWAKTTGTSDTQTLSGVQVGSYPGDDLKSTNVARAESTDCTDCRTVAVAVQAVFATGHPSTVEPTNAAIALNQNCTRCTTYAFAYQYVVTTDGPVTLERPARHRIARLRHEIAAVADSNLAPPDMDTRLNELAGEFKTAIDDGLQAAGDNGHGHVEEQHRSDG
jgi:hypothetical protein